MSLFLQSSYHVVFSNAMKNAFHAFKFCSRANSWIFSYPSLVKARGAVATVENLFIRRFEKAVGHLVSEKWSSNPIAIAELMG